MKKNNEHNAATAFSLILSAITGSTYSLIESPDEQNRKTSDIDYVFGTSAGTKRLVAAEHTIVESFEGEIGYVKWSFDIVAEINALLYSPLHARDRLERALRIDALSPGWRASFVALLESENKAGAIRPREPICASV